LDLPLQLCSQDEVEEFLPSIISALEQNRIQSTLDRSFHRQHQEPSSAFNTNAITNLSEYWSRQRAQWPQLLHTFVGLPCDDGAIALAPQESDFGLAVLHRVFSNHDVR
jgi:hypothetical protein